MATCGNCKKQGQTVEHIRQCYGQRGSVATAQRPVQPPIHKTWLDAYREHAAEKDAFARREAEQERAAYEAKMRRDEALFNAGRVGGNKNGTPVSTRRGSDHPTVRNAVVDAIKSLTAQLPDLPKMHYALEEQDGWHFYRIDQPKKGKWAGFTFIDAQASSDYWPIKSLDRKADILRRIVERGAEQAASDYGHQIGKCGICSRTLTNPESIERGIGPVCAGNAGW